MVNNNSLNTFSAAQLTITAEQTNLYKVSKSTSIAFLSAILAGIFIAIAFAFYTTVTTGTEELPYGIAKLTGGLCFSLGLILVVVCGNDLFTSTVLTMLPTLTRKIHYLVMLRNWITVYAGNFVGALFFVIIIWFAGQHNLAHGQWGANILLIADHKLHHSFTEALFLGLLANLLVCLAVWMSYAGNTLIDKVSIMLLPVAMFVASGFEHSIANMFMIPMGIVIKNFAPEDFWIHIGQSIDQYNSLSIKHFIFDNLIPVTLGNILGGLILVFSYWCLHLTRKPHQ